MSAQKPIPADDPGGNYCLSPLLIIMLEASSLIPNRVMRNKIGGALLALRSETARAGKEKEARRRNIRSILMMYTLFLGSIRSAASAIGVSSALLLIPAASPVLAEEKPDLDVPYVPTPPAVVQKMLDMADVKQGDYVIDLGSGDGRIAIAAVKRGATAMGVDLDPERVQEARQNARKAGVEDRVTFRRQDLFNTDFSDADVLTLYLFESINKKLRPRILSGLEPGTRVVSHAFDMGDWKPDDKANVDGRNVFFWVVPAQIEGKWELRNGERNIDVSFDQSFQELSGTATIGGRTVPITNGRVKGDRVTFTIDNGSGQSETLSGRLEDGQIISRKSGSGRQTAPDWEASRAS